MKKRFNCILPALLIIIIILPGILVAQSEEGVPPEWFTNPPELENIEVIVESAETLPIAIMKALGQINNLPDTTAEIPAYERFMLQAGEEITASREEQKNVMGSQTFGRISFESDRQDFEAASSKSTEAVFQTGNDSLTLFITEYVSVPDVKKYSFSKNHTNLTFGDFTRELSDTGVKIEHQTGLTKSYVKLEVPSHLLLTELEKFKASDAYDELRKELFDQPDDENRD